MRTAPPVWLAAVFLCLGPGSGTAAAAGDWASPVVGGGGGSPFALRCPAGEHLAGVSARIGDDMDAVGPICAGARADGSRGSRLSRSGPAGGGGGQPRELICPDDAPFVRSLTVQGEGVDTFLVDGVTLLCGPLAGPMPRTVDGYNRLTALGGYHAHGGGIGVSSLSRTDWKSFDCPDGMAPVGVQGRAGAMVDALGLLCGTRVTAAPPPPPRGASVQDTTRKGAGAGTAAGAPAPPPAPSVLKGGLRDRSR